MRISGWIVLLILVALLSRGLILFYGDVNWWAPLSDETPTGNVAAALSSGSLVMPWQAYQFKPFAGGTVLEGLLAAPFYARWGDSLLALRMAPLIFCILTMIVWILFVNRLFSRRAAILTGWLFALPPPLYGLLSVTAWGNHTESALLTIIALWWLLAMLGIARSRKPGMMAGFGLGVLCGFGLWFTYTFIVTVFLLLLLWALLDPRWPRQKAFAVFWPGILVGLIPWYANLSFWGARAMFRIDTYTGYESTAFIEGSRLFLETDIPGILVKGLRLAGYGLPRSALFPALGPVPGSAFSAAFFVMALAGAVLLLLSLRSSLSNPLRKNRKRAMDPKLAILFFPPLFCLVLVLSGFRVEDFRLSRPQEYVNYRYLGPALPFIFAWIGIGADAAINMLRNRKAPAYLTAALLTLLITAIGLVPCLDLARIEAPRFTALKFRGSDPELVLQRLAGLVGGAEMSTPISLEILRQLPPQHVAVAFEHFGYIGPPAADLADKMDLQARGRYRSDLNRGLGRHAAKEELNILGTTSLTDPCPLLDQIQNRSRPSQTGDLAFWEGVGMELGDRAVAEPGLLAEKARSIGIPDSGPPAAQAIALIVRSLASCQNSPQSRNSLERGLGRLSVEAFNVMPGQTPMVDEPGFYTGIGAQLRRNALFDLTNDEVAIQALFRVPREFQPYALKGWLEESERLSVQW